jgi:hypothetical protein
VFDDDFPDHESREVLVIKRDFEQGVSFFKVTTSFILLSYWSYYYEFQKVRIKFKPARDVSN